MCVLLWEERSVIIRPTTPVDNFDDLGDDDADGDGDGDGVDRGSNGGDHASGMLLLVLLDLMRFRSEKERNW